jgi:hypothetical protein
MFTNGMNGPSTTTGTFPLTGNETIPCDTNLTAGSGAESVALSTQSLGLAGTPGVLTSAATVALTGGTVPNARNMSLTLGTNVTFTAPAIKANFTLTLTQDATGSRTGTFPASFLFVGGSKTLTTTAAAVDTVTGIYSPTLSGTTWTDRWLCELLKAYA